MISFIKKNLNKTYFFLALTYSIILPITIMLNNKFQFHTDPFTLFTRFISIIAILTILFFSIDIIINKTNLLKFIKNNKSSIFLILSFTFLTIACFNAKDAHLAIFGNKERFGGLLSYLFYFFLAILGYKLNLKHRQIFFRSIIYLSTIICLFSLINSNTIQQFLFLKYSGIFFNTNHFATFLVYTIVINIFTFYNDKTKYLNLIDYLCYLILTTILILNNTFGCYLAILFILIVSIIFIIKNKLYLKYAILLITFIILSLTIKIDGYQIIIYNFKSLLFDLNIIKEYSTIKQDLTEEENTHYVNDHLRYIGSYRGELWYYTIDLIKQKPLLGYGLESLKTEYSNNYIFECEEDLPHNLILHLWVTGGIFTILFYLIANLMILIKYRKHFYQNSFLTVIYFIILAHLFQSMFNNTLFYVTSIYAIFFGMIYHQEKKKTINKKSVNSL